MSDVKTGHRLVFSIDEKDVGQSATVSVVFNEPINVGAADDNEEIDAFLRGVIRFTTFVVALTEYWSVHVDHHGRVFSTGMSNMFGALRTWRVEDFTMHAHEQTSGTFH